MSVSILLIDFRNKNDHKKFEAHLLQGVDFVKLYVLHLKSKM